MYPQDIDQAIYIFQVEAIVLGQQTEHRATDCWCSPCVERYPEGDLVIHRDFEDGGN